MSIPYAECSCECTGELPHVGCTDVPATTGPRPRIWRVGNGNGFAGSPWIRRTRGYGVAGLPETPIQPSVIPRRDEKPLASNPSDGMTPNDDPWSNNPGSPHTPVYAKPMGYRQGGVIKPSSSGIPRRVATSAGETRDVPGNPGGPTTRVPRGVDQKTGPYDTNPGTGPTPPFGNEPHWNTTKEDVH